MSNSVGILRLWRGNVKATLGIVSSYGRLKAEPGDPKGFITPSTKKAYYVHVLVTLLPVVIAFTALLFHFLIVRDFNV